MGTIGMEWVNKYYGRGSDLSYCDTDARGFYFKLNGTRKFGYGDDSAWDEDFEEQGVGAHPAGTDDKYVETVDMVYFAGHSNIEGLKFGRTAYDNGEAAPSEMRLGQKSLKWLVLSSCAFLKYNESFFKRMKPIFCGLHYILGFHTTCSDSKDRGEIFASNLNKKYTIRQAWVQACIETESSSTVCAYMHVENPDSNTYLDHWIGKGYVSPSPNSFNKMYYFATSC